jgi:hypothetical protein
MVLETVAPATDRGIGGRQSVATKLTKTFKAGCARHSGGGGYVTLGPGLHIRRQSRPQKRPKGNRRFHRM